MIGEIRKTLTPFYDKKAHQNAFKARPALVIAKADNKDYVILPVSRVTKAENRDPVYDIPVDPAIYPELNLTSMSYIRTHKQTIVHIAELGDKIGDLKNNYPDLYDVVLTKREDFSVEISRQAKK